MSLVKLLRNISLDHGHNKRAKNSKDVICMIILNTKFSEEEKKVLDYYLRNDYTILNEIMNNCFILSRNGEFSYNECFTPVNDFSINNFRFSKANPKRVIKVYGFYLMEVTKEEGHWYRGEQDENQNIRFYGYCESLEYAIRSL